MSMSQSTTSLVKQTTFKDDVKKTIQNIGMSRFLIFLFFVFLLFVTRPQEMPETIGNIFVRVGLNCVLVLAMVPSIKSGLGPNFGIPFGIIAGLLGGLISIEMKMTGVASFAVAIVIGIVIAIPFGIFYGILLNKVKGSEMMISTYFGNAIVSLMCIGWLVLPFNSPDTTWTMKANGGLRTTIALDNYFGSFLNKIAAIEIPFEKGSTFDMPIVLTLVITVVIAFAWFRYIKEKEFDAEAADTEQLNEFREYTAANKKKGYVILAGAIAVWLIVYFVRPTGVLGTIRSIFVTSGEIKTATSLVIPTGMIVFSLICCVLIWAFLNTKSGVAMSAVGANPSCARASGINVDKMRLLGSVVSTVLGAVGILVYAQGFGFLQLYTAPMFMAFPAIAAILIGGASTTEAKVSNVLLGVILFQGILTMGPPVASRFLSTIGGGNDPSEVVRIIITNGVILYALTKAGGNSREK